MPLDIIVGTQWGDEGKGRIVDLLAAQADFVARFNGGDNAGHTVRVGETTFKLHLIPSGVIHPQPVGLIGNGVVVNPAILLDEMERLRSAGVSLNSNRLRISHAAHLITPAHLALDKAQEAARGKQALGTTLRGIGPAYTTKVARTGLRMASMQDPQRLAEDVRALVDDTNRQLQALYNAEPLDARVIANQFEEYASSLRGFIADISTLLSEALARGQRVLAEGAQGTLLDLDHGSYPFVTSSSTTAPGALSGLGLGLGCEGRVIGVTKAFQTRVGAGPFPTELDGEIAYHLRGSGANPWDEYGTTTGRPRRVGWLDLILLRYSARINGLTELALTKLDILTGLDTIRLCTAYQEGDHSYQDLPLGLEHVPGFTPVYEQLPGWKADLQQVRRWEDLPAEARDYILRIEEYSGVPVRMVSVGPERDQVVEIGD